MTDSRFIDLFAGVVFTLHDLPTVILATFLWPAFIMELIFGNVAFWRMVRRGEIVLVDDLDFAG